MRRIAVHFWPVFWVMSRATSRKKALYVSLDASASGPRTAELRLSASTLTRTESWTIGAPARRAAAVEPPPVKERTSSPVRWSSRSPGGPATSDSAPSGRIFASTMSSTMRCATIAVLVAGLTTIGMPASSAQAAFSPRPHAGKLKALT
jgi:hypothetical protein